MADLELPERRETTAEPARPTKKVTPTKRATPANLQPPAISAGRDPLAGHRVLMRTEHLERQGTTPSQDFLAEAQAQTRMTHMPTLPPLSPSHLEKGPRRLLPSWRSPQFQLAHGSLSWPGERTGDRSRAEAGQCPSLASFPQLHLGHRSSNADVGS